MKKIALLFTIICASQLYGMEPLYPEHGMGAFGEFPQDVHNEIIKKAIESDTFKKPINAINVATALWGVKYDNLKDFTRLVHLLADKFNATTDSIAKQFKTPIADEYLRLGHLLMERIDLNRSYNMVTEVADSINQGADVNFSTNLHSIYTRTPLKEVKAYSEKYFGYGKIQQILIQAGAKE